MKTVNYTTEQVTALVAAYVEADTQEARDEVVSTFATDFGKSVASIRAKLSREGVYVKKEAAASKSSKIKKDEKVTALANAMGVDEDLVGDLEKLTHRTLDILLFKVSH